MITNKMKISCTVFLLLFAIQGYALGGYKTTDDSTKVKKKRNLRVLPLPAISNAPETSWEFGAVCLFTGRLYNDTLTRLSNGKIEATYTLRNQFILDLDWNLFLKGDKLVILGDATFRRFPEYFWGIGNKLPNSNKELYDAKRIELNLKVIKRYGRIWYPGLHYEMQYMFDIKPTAGRILETQNIPGSTGSFSSGFGPMLLIDSRDNVLNPSKGFYAGITTTVFGKYIGSQYGFTRVGIDVRKFIPLESKKHTLALQFSAINIAGSPPFRLLSLTGGEREMRGYYTGRYRDKNYINFQCEYRGTVYRRWGLAVFAGVGDVYNQPKDLSISFAKYSVGGGLRFMTDRKERTNLRLDYAVGRGTSGFYVSFGEAF